ncbi:MAG: N-acetylmuramidase [Flavobacteriaceae bacterium]|nr:N-acetylmuramidase [Flavobacteriaceae bacterium]
MARNRYLTVNLLFLVLLFSRCGSAKKFRVYSVQTQKESTENIQVKPTKKVTKPPKISKNLTVEQQINRYIKTYADVAQQEMRSYDIPASITLAQGILESGMGASRLATEANNHFGIKCHKGWKGKRIYQDDDKKGECFRVYSDPVTSYRDHSLFLTTRSRYDFLFDLKKEDYKAWAKGLKKAGYATDPKYPDKLVRLIERYRLDRYDLKRKKSKKENFTPTAQESRVHRVEKGDTLYSISKKYRVEVEHIVQANTIEANTIFVGQNLIIPQNQ